ncbi:single-stranded DNA-binding protein [Microbacterium sp. SORGH_AS_0888]|uniref:single-stranded DNA-binding protein n=1 Tax=Microbacterium sp. SORGH_AS_0888 TaxID=3041791 RepID=UPI0027861A9A|nr:single-stranded DNA-binding protein [Microbacterium sp. SORGH_AS_0888]MDQ1128756.1 single-strand DNA-binding protein [Microbacterium sp. SORGH_AS_0888]
MSETITIVGNVAAAPERRDIGNGVEVTKFRVGCTQRRFDAQQGKWVDGHTNWYSVSAFRALGTHAFASLRRGERVIVTGKLRIRTWENDSGRGTSVEVDADAIGHDLLWGTSLFQEAPRSAPASTPTSEAASGTAGDWGAPAAVPDPWVAARPVEPAAEPVPAGAPPEDTPF